MSPGKRQWNPPCKFAQRGSGWDCVVPVTVVPVTVVPVVIVVAVTVVPVVSVVSVTVVTVTVVPVVSVVSVTVVRVTVVPVVTVDDDTQSGLSHVVPSGHDSHPILNIPLSSVFWTAFGLVVVGSQNKADTQSWAEHSFHILSQ